MQKNSAGIPFCAMCACNYLGSLKMTLISMAFLILSALLMIFKIDFPFDFAIVTIIISGLPIVYKGFKNLIKNKKLTAPLLITIAMIAAICTNQLFAAAEVAFIMAIGSILEDLTIKKARAGVSKLISFMPKTARKITAENVEQVSAECIKKGDIIRVLAGENIPCDGVIIKGETSVDQSIVTGESIPVDKKEGGSVFSGSINNFGVIDIEAAKDYKDSSVQKLVKLIKEAEEKKAPVQKIVDIWASFLIPAALIFAIIVYFATGEILRAVTILVVFCPCSLVLATPVSIVAAIGQAAKNGIIVKNGAALEIVGKCSVFAFDKTGTLTEGKLEVCSVEAFNGETKENILYIAACAEAKSEHPIGKAILEFANSKDISIKETQDFKISLGKGIYSKLDGKRIFIGTETFLKDNDIEISDEVKLAAGAKRTEGKIVLILGYDKKASGVISLADKIKESAVPLLNYLNNKNCDTILLTGDNSLTAEFFAKKTGIKKVYSGLLPKDKASLIEKIKGEKGKVVMTGDGINDSIALKTADAGVSMGEFGSDAAIESSDIIITSSDLLKIEYLKKLSDECIKVIKTNITFSMCVNFISLTCSAMGLLNPLTGAVVHNIASILVVSNAALFYKKKI